ncbi:MAG: long-chain fatty acid--CoA ligase [Myxococcota bacterium]|nr:long-chain fatty acid--CoA ligase [Myxococcota bacterium]
MERHTLVHRLLEQAEDLGTEPALRYREDGDWHEISWDQYQMRVLDLGAGLIDLGVRGGDRVAMLSHNQPAWVISDLAILAAGAASVPAYPNSIPSQVEYLIEHSDSEIIFVANGTQLRKVQQVWESCSNLRYVILMDNDEDLADGERVLTLDSVIERGIESGRDLVEQRLAAIDPEKLATIIYTSGTTGPPKGAMLSHVNLTFMADALADVILLNEDDSTLSFLPLSHVAERLQGQVCALSQGATVNFAESMDTIVRDLGEVNATTLLCVPRLWEKIYAKIQSGLEEAPPLRRRIFDWSIAQGTEAFELRNSGQTPSPVLAAKLAVADRLVFSKLRAGLGMTHSRKFLSGAAPLSSQVGTFFASIGFVIQEAYGQTECTGVCNVNRRDHVKFGTVGPNLPGVEVRLAEDGEIMVRGPNVFLGYFKEEAATAAALVDGWLATGDIGAFDEEEHLRITDRKKDIIVTAGGKNVAPQNIENLLKPCRGISQVVVVGDKRKFLSALVTLDYPEMELLLEEDLSDHDACVDHPKVLTQIQSYVDEVNGTLASYESIKKFRVLSRDLTIEDDEVTPTLKVKRRVVQKSYEALIDSMYAEKFE